MTETPVDKPVRIFLAISLSTFLFALMNLFVKLAAETHPIPQVMFFRNAIGMIPVIWLILKNRDTSLFRTRNFAGHFVRSFVGFFSMYCIFWSFKMLPLANATAILFSSPLILTSLSVVLLDEKVGLHRWTAVIIGLAAVLFMLQPASGSSAEGSLIAMCAAILMAFAMISIRKLSKTEHSLTIVFYFSTFCTIMSGLWMMANWINPSALSLCYLLATGLLGGVAQVFMTYAYAKSPAAYVSAFSYFGIVIAATLDFIVWGFVPVWQVLVGSPIVIAAGLYIVWREAKKNYKPTALLDPDISSPDLPVEGPKQKDADFSI
ncbi:MAG: DMT family transporter [Micavibrio aeruginosavorus]|uniref:DMT family transporter n=1 Tax=Micavibrio aeruginosavorus TaxID=349221 RepID=A0A7T5R197_9BACT|nr:MAG: DMT family transporter [Micavibrio aeruginosavorus]